MGGSVPDQRIRMVSGVVCRKILLLMAKNLLAGFLLIFASIAQIVSLIFDLCKERTDGNKSKKITHRDIRCR